MQAWHELRARPAEAPVRPKAWGSGEDGGGRTVEMAASVGGKRFDGQLCVQQLPNAVGYGRLRSIYIIGKDTMRSRA